MKNSIVVLVFSLALLPLAAQALPGSSSLQCQSLKGAKVNIQINAKAAQIGGVDSGFPSSAEFVVNNKSYKEENAYGTLAGINFLRHALDKVIDISYTSDKITFEVWALPGTIRLIKGSDDLKGKATFRAHATGIADGESQGYIESTVRCVLTYSGGSAG